MLSIDNDSLKIKSPKLTVKSRRKSSFYYSNQKNSSLVHMIQLRESTNKKDQKTKKLKRKAP